MIEVYSLGVRLGIHDVATPVLLKLSREFAKLEVLTKSLNREMNLATGSVAGLNAIGRAAGAIDRNLGGAAARAAQLQRELKGLAAVQVAPAVGVGPAPRAGGGLSAGRHGLHGGNLHFGPHGFGVGAVGLGVMSPPALAAGAGVGGSMFITKRLADAAGDFEMERVRLKSFGMSEKLNAEAEAFVRSLKTLGVSMNENFHLFNKAQGVFRESGLDDSHALEGAKLATPMLAKLKVLSSLLGGEKGARLDNQALPMLRYIEMSGGLTSAKRFNELAENAFKLILTSGGNIDWEQLRQLRARGGAGTQKMSDRALVALEPIIGEMKGSTFGTAMRTGLGRIMGGVKIPNQVAHALVESGMWDPSKVVFNSQGGIKTFKGNPLRADVQKDYEEDFDLFVFRQLQTLYDRLKVPEKDYGRYDTMLFGPVLGGIIPKIRQQRKVIEHSQSAYDKAKGIDAVLADASKTYEGGKKDFVAAWTDFKTTFGERVLPQATDLIKNASAFMRSIGGFLEANKELIKGAQKIEPHVLGGPVRFVGEHIWNLIKNGIKPPLKDGEAAPLPKDFDFIKAGPGRPITVITRVELDRRQIAEAVTKVQSEELRRPPTGPNRFDPTMGPLYPGQSITGTW